MIRKQGAKQDQKEEAGLKGASQARGSFSKGKERQVSKNIIRDGDGTALHTSYTALTVYTM